MIGLVPTPPRVVVQGITGREAAMVVRHMNAYGTLVSAGVTPGKGGEVVDGIGVYDTIDAAQAATGGAPFDVSIVYVPPLAAWDAASEALASGTRVLVIVTENIPLHDSLAIHRAAVTVGATVIGPNSVGVICPASRVKLGAIGGSDPARAFVAGHVGVISRSGGLTAEIALQLRRNGRGVSAAVSVGGDAMIGLEPADAAKLLNDDEDTRAIVYIGEPGTAMEERLARRISRGEISKPVYALILGEFMEAFPKGTLFGHAGAVIESEAGTPREKKRMLAEAGAVVASSLDDLIGKVVRRTDA